MTTTIMMVGDDDITITITYNLSLSTASHCRMLVIPRGISLCLYPRCSEEQGGGWVEVVEVVIVVEVVVEVVVIVVVIVVVVVVVASNPCRRLCIISSAISLSYHELCFDVSYNGYITEHLGG
jgi:hypothetical protein